MKTKLTYTAPGCRIKIRLEQEKAFLASGGTTLDPIKDDDSTIEWDE